METDFSSAGGTTFYYFQHLKWNGLLRGGKEFLYMGGVF